MASLAKTPLTNPNWSCQVSVLLRTAAMSGSADFPQTVGVILSMIGL